MSFFVQPTDAPKPKSQNVRIVSIITAGVLVVLAVSQLFSFEDFPGVLASLWLPGGDAMARMLAALIVSVEVLAVPFLLSMKLSPAMRAFSMVMGWLVAATWIKLTLWENLTTNAITNVGLLGATVPLPTGWWSVCFALAFGILVAWASWGMWPLKRRRAK